MTTTCKSAAPTAKLDIRRVIDDFHEQGFVHIPQLLSRQEVAELRAAVEAAVTAEQNGKMAEQAGILSTVDGWERHDAPRNPDS